MLRLQNKSLQELYYFDDFEEKFRFSGLQNTQFYFNFPQEERAYSLFVRLTYFKG